MRKVLILILLAACDLYDGDPAPPDATAAAPDAAPAARATCTATLERECAPSSCEVAVRATFTCDATTRAWARLGVVTSDAPLILETTYACGETVEARWSSACDVTVINGGAVARDPATGADFGCEAELPPVCP